jgi:hypothetical protein
MRKLMLFLLCLAVLGAALAVGYDWLKARPELVPGVVLGGLCLASMAGIVVGAFWTYYAVRAGAQVATYNNASQSGATKASVELAKEIVRQFGGASASSPTRVVDAPALPLPSQARQVQPWLPPLEGFESGNQGIRESGNREDWKDGRSGEEW